MYKLAQRNVFFSEVTKLDLAPLEISSSNIEFKEMGLHFHMHFYQCVHDHCSWLFPVCKFLFILICAHYISFYLVYLKIRSH